MEASGCSLPECRMVKRKRGQVPTHEKDYANTSKKRKITPSDIVFSYNEKLQKRRVRLIVAIISLQKDDSWDLFLRGLCCRDMLTSLQVEEMNTMGAGEKADIILDCLRNVNLDDWHSAMYIADLFKCEPLFGILNDVVTF